MSRSPRRPPLLLLLRCQCRGDTAAASSLLREAHAIFTAQLGAAHPSSSEAARLLAAVQEEAEAAAGGGARRPQGPPLHAEAHPGAGKA